MFPVCGEDVILPLGGVSGTDLGGFLASQRNPESQLSLALNAVASWSKRRTSAMSA